MSRLLLCNWLLIILCTCNFASHVVSNCWAQTILFMSIASKIAKGQHHEICSHAYHTGKTWSSNGWIRSTYLLTLQFTILSFPRSSSCSELDCCTDPNFILMCACLLYVYYWYLLSYCTLIRFTRRGETYHDRLKLLLLRLTSSC